jgi:hypothetical protein
MLGWIILKNLILAISDDTLPKDISSMPPNYNI